MAIRERTPFVDRVARFIQITKDPSACWLWTGSLRNGYGQIKRGGRKGKLIYAHRAVWEFVYGPILPAMCVCHMCDERRCCRPDHLFLGTKGDNLADMRDKQRHQHGAHHYRARFTDDQVRAIRSSSESSRVEAARYGVTLSTIQMIRRRVRWTHVA